MHGSRSETARLIEELLGHAPAELAAVCVVCPPFVYLHEAGRLLRDSAFSPALRMYARMRRAPSPAKYRPPC